MRAHGRAVLTAERCSRLSGAHGWSGARVAALAPPRVRARWAPLWRRRLQISLTAAGLNWTCRVAVSRSCSSRSMSDAASGHLYDLRWWPRCVAHRTHHGGVCSGSFSRISVQVAASACACLPLACPKHKDDRHENDHRPPPTPYVTSWAPPWAAPRVTRRRAGGGGVDRPFHSGVLRTFLFASIEWLSI